MEKTKNSLCLLLVLMMVVCVCAACGEPKPTDAESSDLSSENSESNVISSDVTDEITSSDIISSDTVSSDVTSSAVTSGAVSSSKTGVVSSSSRASSNSGGDNKTDGFKFSVPTLKKNLKDDKVVDMQGYTFTFASAWMPLSKPKNPTLQEKLFYERKAQVEKEYNCKIKVISIYADMATLAPKIMAGDKIADVIELMPSMLVPAAYAGYFRDWNTVKGIDTSDSRWVESYKKLGVVNGKQYGIQFTNPPEVRYCMYYNRDVLKSAGVKDDLETLVKKGEWTFSKFREIAIKCTKDTNNDGKPDVYGLLQDAPYGAGYAFVAANGGKIVDIKNGKPTVSFDTKNVLNALNFYDNLVNKDKAVYLWGHESSELTWNNTPTVEDWRDAFMNRKAAFVIGEAFYGSQYFKPLSSKSDYGILPLPMGPDAKDYVSPAQNARLCVATSTNNDIDKTAVIFNALARPMKGYEDPNWWYEDIELEYFREGDKKSAEMYRFILSKSDVDIGQGIDKLYSDFLYSTVACGMYWHYETPASYIKSLKDAGYQDLVNNVCKQK